MEQIAFVVGSHFICWSSVILVIAAAAAIFLFLSFYLGKGGNSIAGFLVVPLAAFLSLLAARLLHWYCFADTYQSLSAALTDYSTGNMSLLGVFVGCLAAAVLTRLIRLHRNLPRMLDCMCLAGCAGISAGRLASFFNATDRGHILESIHSMPWAYPVVNSISGATEYRLATFLLQAMVAGVLFFALALYYLLGKKRKDGDIALLFLLCYGASEIVLDSTRYDSMYFRSNGFVSIIQVCGAIALVTGIILISIRLVKTRGLRRWYFPIWISIVGLICCAGYMEYHVQRHANEAFFAYGIMLCCLSIVVCLSLLMYMFGKRKGSTRIGKKSY